MATARDIRVDGNTAYVPLTKGYEAIVDVADLHLVSGKLWCADVRHRKDGTVRTVYAVRVEADGEKQRTILMHRVIAETPDGMETDHHDGNGLDNRRDNLRNATIAQNRQNAAISADNTTGFKGVCWDKRTGKWKAQIAANGRRSERRFITIEAAAAWRAEQAVALHKEFARAS